MASKSIQHHPKRSGTRWAQVGPGCSHSPFLGAVSLEGYASQSVPTARAAPQTRGRFHARTQLAAARAPPFLSGWPSRSATHSLLDCVVASLGLILDKKCHRPSTGHAVQPPDPRRRRRRRESESERVLFACCTPTATYLLDSYLTCRDLPHQLQGGRVDPVLLWSAPSRRAFPTLPVVVQPHRPLGLFILTLARSQASERRPLRRVRRCRRLRGCPHLHRVHLDANLGARARHLVGYFGNLTQPHRVHLA